MSSYLSEGRKSRDEDELVSHCDENMDVGVQMLDKLDLNVDQVSPTPNVTQLSGT